MKPTSNASKPKYRYGKRIFSVAEEESMKQAEENRDSYDPRIKAMIKLNPNITFIDHRPRSSSKETEGLAEKKQEAFVDDKKVDRFINMLKVNNGDEIKTECEETINAMDTDDKVEISLDPIKYKSKENETINAMDTDDKVEISLDSIKYKSKENETINAMDTDDKVEISLDSIKYKSKENETIDAMDTDDKVEISLDSIKYKSKENETIDAMDTDDKVEISLDPQTIEILVDCEETMPVVNASKEPVKSIIPLEQETLVSFEETLPPISTTEDLSSVKTDVDSFQKVKDVSLNINTSTAQNSIRPTRIETKLIEERMFSFKEVLGFWRSLTNK
ncbi:hypothetical protein NGRA_3429 [Nosema granulosis]|uniref:Uncharacterized protein n=1 Tax=Nosema granulosis TaxID=83296 RepID=A0A9P6KXI2_9MICR|nr:hypothetical protein NGRA_3429 [Nosema granulosis]